MSGEELNKSAERKKKCSLIYAALENYKKSAGKELKRIQEYKKELELSDEEIQKLEGFIAFLEDPECVFLEEEKHEEIDAFIEKFAEASRQLTYLKAEKTKKEARKEIDDCLDPTPES